MMVHLLRAGTIYTKHKQTIQSYLKIEIPKTIKAKAMKRKKSVIIWSLNKAFRVQV